MPPKSREMATVKVPKDIPGDGDPKAQGIFTAVVDSAGALATLQTVFQMSDSMLRRQDSVNESLAKQVDKSINHVAALAMEAATAKAELAITRRDLASMEAEIEGLRAAVLHYEKEFTELKPERAALAAREARDKGLAGLFEAIINRVPRASVLAKMLFEAKCEPSTYFARVDHHYKLLTTGGIENAGNQAAISGESEGK